KQLRCERAYQCRSRSETRRHHVPASPPISIGPRRVRRGDLVGHHMASDCNLRCSILAAHVCDRCRLSSVFLTPSLLDKSGVSIHSCIHCPKQRSEKRSLVGCETPPSPSSFRHRAGRTFASAQRYPVQSCQLDLLSTARCNQSGEGFGFCILS